MGQIHKLAHHLEVFPEDVAFRGLSLLRASQPACWVQRALWVPCQDALQSLKDPAPCQLSVSSWAPLAGLTKSTDTRRSWPSGEPLANDWLPWDVQVPIWETPLAPRRFTSTNPRLASPPFPSCSSLPLEAPGRAPRHSPAPAWALTDLHKLVLQACLFPDSFPLQGAARISPITEPQR